MIGHSIRAAHSAAGHLLSKDRDHLIWAAETIPQQPPIRDSVRDEGIILADMAHGGNVRDFSNPLIFPYFASNREKSGKALVRMERLELSRSCPHQILSLARLPIPPHPQTQSAIT